MNLSVHRGCDKRKHLAPWLFTASLLVPCPIHVLVTAGMFIGLNPLQPMHSKCFGFERAIENDERLAAYS